jgi:glycosyltransferase involved in cell wall biosynthesis
MRIGIDATGLGTTKTGTVVYLVEILDVWRLDASLDHRFVVFVAPKSISLFAAFTGDPRFEFVLAPDRRPLRIAWQQLVLPWLLVSRCIDVHWGTGFVLPLLATRPMAVTIHDLTFQLFPAVHEWVKRYYFPLMIRASIARARKVLAVSRATFDDVCSLFPAAFGKTVVTLLAARRMDSGGPADAVQLPSEADRPYVLFVGTLEPRKNLQRLLDAWTSLPPDLRATHRLLVVGVKGWMVDELVQSVADDSVHFLGSVSDAMLDSLLRHARCFAYPSLYEGFGLPVLEAMAAGVPVLTSRVGATREVAADAAVLIDPTDTGSIAEGLLRLLVDTPLRETLALRGRRRSEDFSWVRTADLTLHALLDLQPRAAAPVRSARS